MWQRFTERARQTVFHAQEVAQKRGSDHVSTEHLLWGLLQQRDSTSSRVLKILKVSTSTLLEKLEEKAGKPTEPENRVNSEMTLTPRSKRVIDFAYDEARNLENNYIGTEHLLLGIIREADGVGGRVLSELGVQLDAARLAVKRCQTTNANEPNRPPANASVTLLTLLSNVQAQINGKPKFEEVLNRTVEALWGMKGTVAERVLAQLNLPLAPGHNLKQIEIVPPNECPFEHLLSESSRAADFLGRRRATTADLLYALYADDRLRFDRFAHGQEITLGDLREAIHFSAPSRED